MKQSKQKSLEEDHSVIQGFGVHPHSRLQLPFLEHLSSEEYL